MKRPARTFVIDQDEHLQNLRKIIKRDFFGSASAQQQAETVKMNLNGYLQNYKSNENQLFSEMVQTNREEWREKHWWIDKQDKLLMIGSSQKFKALPYHNMLEKNEKINGIDTSIVKQDAKNSLFFNRQLNYGSLQSRQYEQGKKVVYSNCKFDDPVSKMKAQMAVKQEEFTPARETQKQGKRNVQRSQRVADTPLRQTVDDNMMTWGQIQSTPIRLSGPDFRIPQTPQREQLLYEMNTKIKNQKNNSKKSELALKILGSLTPSFNSSRQRMASSIRRIDSVKRDKNRQKNDLSGLLNIKKQ